MIHYLFIGHFEHEGAFIRFQRQTESRGAPYYPVVRRPLHQAVVTELLAEIGVVLPDIPVDWGMAFRDTGYIVWDRFCRNEDAWKFISRLATRTACDLADYSSLTLASLCDLERDRSSTGTVSGTETA